MKKIKVKAWAGISENRIDPHGESIGFGQDGKSKIGQRWAMAVYKKSRDARAAYQTVVPVLIIDPRHFDVVAKKSKRKAVKRG